MPTDVQALTVLQDLLSDDFQAKNTYSLQRKGEDTHSTKRNEAFQLIQKIHNQLQTVQWDLQILHSTFRYPYRTPNPYSRRQRALQSRIQFYMQKAKRSSGTSIHPTRPSKGIPGIPVIHDIQPSRHYYMFQYFQYLPVHPGFHPITAFSNYNAYSTHRLVSTETQPSAS